jgi:carboxymethylenebutenolidase
MMILPEVRGLHPFYEDLAVRFAQAGVHATVMDYFGRSAGLGERGADFDFMSHVRQITADVVGADTKATITHLRSEAGGGAERVYSVGFCMGGRIAVEGFRRALDVAGVENEIVVYEGASHSFFNWGSGEHREACDDAWRRMLRFVGLPAG